MKKSFAKTLILIVALVLVLAVALPTLFACNKKEKTLTLEDIFVNSTSPKEFTSYEDVLVLRAGWSMYLSSSSSSQDSSNSDIGYINDIDGFVVQKDGILSIAKCSDTREYFSGYEFEGQLFPKSIGITALRVKNGIIVCKFLNGEAGAFDYNGKTLISRRKITGVGNTTIDNVIRILDSGLIAVSGQYDTQGQSGYTSIYRPTYSGANETRGELVCRVKNTAGNLSYVNGFENKYVSVVGNGEATYLFSVPDHASGEVPNLSSNNGVVEYLDEEDYFQEITYIGRGRFLIHEDWTVDKTDDYTYYDGNDYYVFKRRIYDASRDTMADYNGNSDKVFLNLTNKYYDSSKGGIDVKTYLKDGYMYASYGLLILDKTAYYDQYILDENLNIVMSLTGNFGITLDTKDKDTVSAFDLIMTADDGNYYVPYLPSKLAVYNGAGEKLGENKEYTFKSQNIANDVIIACMVDKDDKTKEVYSIFNLKCEELTEEIVTESGKIKYQKYDQIAAFRGFYTLAKRDGKCYLIGKDGVEVPYMSDGTTVPFADIALSGSATGSQPLFKIGCYIFKVTTQDSEGNKKTKYGIKNFNANVQKNVIMDAQIESAPTLYSPSYSPTDVFVFETITASGSTTIVVHKLV